MIYECVINISEGKNQEVIDSISKAGGNPVLDIHSDFDHNRSVITIGSTELDEVIDSVKNIFQKGNELLDLADHIGVHPRLGAIDVVPFISYDDSIFEPNSQTIEAAHEFGAWVNNSFDLPVFFYDFASEQFLSLPEIRKNAFVKISPSFSSRGKKQNDAVCVGARKPLLAINVDLDCTDIKFAKDIAKTLRESSGGHKGVRAIGLELSSKDRVQVSMNIVDTIAVNAETICTEIKEIANERDISAKVELVGLVPEHQFKLWSDSFKTWANLDKTKTVENHLSI